MLDMQNKMIILKSLEDARAVDLSREENVAGSTELLVIALLSG